MRQTLQNFYAMLMRLQGGVVLGFVILLIVGAYNSALPGLWHPVPIILTLLATIIAIAFVHGRIVPDLVSQPAGLKSGLAVAALHVIAPLVFMVPVMTSVVAFEIAEPMSRYLAVGSSAVVFVISGVLWWLGVTLSVWSRGGTTEPPAAHPA